ncbi:hypothetical protein Q8F55_008344 [Vanrija albida]|uniref:Uncharacterized protein n=1 Tax=Vanrija albida TaxID=181172 RepID=A0ABR3PWZ7_9TREE
MGLVEDAYRKLGQYVDPKGPSQGSSQPSLAHQCMCQHLPGCSASRPHQAPYAPTPYAPAGNILPPPPSPTPPYAALNPASAGPAAYNAAPPHGPPGSIQGPGGYYLAWDDYKRLLKDKKRMKQLKGTDYAPGGPLGPQGYFMTHKQEKKRRKDKEEDELWDAIFGEL